MPYSIPLFEETLYGADPERDLHVLLRTRGGDGDTALRLVRQAQSRCRRLTVVLPDQAKSAGTIFALGAHQIAMGPTSDMGPIDPQFIGSDGGLVPEKTIIAAVEHALTAIVGRPETLALHASLLADTTAIDVQEARNALRHTDAQLRAALACHPERTEDEVNELASELAPSLIGDPASHGATISVELARALGLPVEELDPRGEQWRMIWELWIQYFNMGSVSVYEGEQASQVFAQE